jgi:hypothetical protein
VTDIDAIRARLERWQTATDSSDYWTVDREIRANAPADLAALLAEVEAIGDLLAVILGDGGHRQAEVGTVQAAAEALERVHALHQREAERPTNVLAEVDSLRRQVEEMRECGLSIHKRVAQERAAIVAYLRGAVDRPAQHVADDIEEGFHHE